METILIDPGRLTEFARRFRAAAREMQALERQLQRSYQSMDWETLLRSGMEGNVGAASREATALAVRAEAMASVLEKTAELFAGADRTQSDGVSKLFAGLRAILSMVLPWGLVHGAVNAVRQQRIMGSVLGPAEGADAAINVPSQPAPAGPDQKVGDPGAFPGHNAMTPEHVSFLQHVLGLPETGEYDEQTRAAVADFQWEYRYQIGLTERAQADGEMGPNTWRALQAINHASGVNVRIDGYDMNTLISDAEFLDKDALSLEQIRGFLKRQNSILATDSFPVWRLTREYPGVDGAIQTEYQGQTYWKYPTGIEVDPAKLIYDSAQKHGISPLVLLTKLEKESSIVSSYQSINGQQMRMDPTWLSTTVAMGFAVPDGGKIDSARTGIDAQIEAAARRSVEMFNEEAPSKYPHVFSKLNYGLGHDFTVKGETVPWAVEVRNRATWVLYRYTPHVTDFEHAREGRLGGGNYLFANVFARYKREATQG